VRDDRPLIHREWSDLLEVLAAAGEPSANVLLDSDFALSRRDHFVRPCYAPQGTSNFSILERSGKMKDQSTRVRALNVLASSAFALCVFASQPAMAGGFTNGSLQGSYAYVNNNEGVASFGPIIFDGNGGLTLQILTNGKCPTIAPGCSRVIGSFDVSGDYKVQPDGTGVATIDFPAPFGSVPYDFVIVKANKKEPSPLAIEVFAAAEGGGIAGQLIAPTWTRRFDN
jgi:hypothetical protein